MEGDDGTPEEQAAFMKELETFHRERAIDFEPPKFDGQPLNCLKLWRAVIRLGGYDRVTGSELWRQVGESFHPPKTCTTVSSLSWTFHIFYEKVTGSKLWRQVGESLQPPMTRTEDYYNIRNFYEKYLRDYETHKVQSGELQLPVTILPEASGADYEDNGSRRGRTDSEQAFERIDPAASMSNVGLRVVLEIHSLENAYTYSGADATWLALEQALPRRPATLMVRVNRDLPQIQRDAITDLIRGAAPDAIVVEGHVQHPPLHLGDADRAAFAAEVAAAVVAAAPPPPRNGNGALVCIAVFCALLGVVGYVYLDDLNEIRENLVEIKTNVVFGAKTIKSIGKSILKFHETVSQSWNEFLVNLGAMLHFSVSST